MLAGDWSPAVGAWWDLQSATHMYRYGLYRYPGWRGMAVGEHILATTAVQQSVLLRLSTLCVDYVC